MSVPVEEGEHNGDHLDRVEEVRWLPRLFYANIANYVLLDSWHYHSIRS